MKRRHFLQFTGSTLATMGFSQFDFLQQVRQCDRVLAQTTPRKLALLIGINHYPGEIGLLKGCLNDVELQRQLLIHRYGFKRADILEISDNVSTKPTRANILQAFHEHLLRQARPGDVVVVHFSGHGSRIKDPHPLNTRECQQIGDCDLNGTMVPLDGMAINQTGSEVAVPDIMGRHLFLLMESIQTEFLTIVLDCCHSGAGTRGNANVRSARSRVKAGQILIPTEAEIEAQEQLLAELKLSLAEFHKRREQGIAKGVAIGSARRNELAVDAVFDGFHAGAFTYLLTRYLWQQATQHSAETVSVNLKRSTERLANQKGRTSQVPIFEFAPDRNHQNQPLYLTSLTSPPAEAVITSVGQEVQFWLGGVSTQNLNGNGAGTIFSVLDSNGRVVGEIEQTGRKGLYGLGKVLRGERDAIKVDRLLRERIVGIPTNPQLKIGLDPSLESDLPIAKTELSKIRIVQLVEMNSSMHYLLGRLTPDYQRQFTETATTNLPAVGSLGLLTPDLSNLLPNTFGHANETITAAISRLRPRLRSLLVNQILGQLLAVGRGSSLRVTASVIPMNQQAEPPGRPLQFASRGAIESQTQMRVSHTPPQFPETTLLKITVENHERQDLYIGVLIIGADGTMDVLYPVNFDAPEEAAQLTPTAPLTIPGPRAEYALTVQGSSGFPEFLVLASKQPLRNTLRALKTIATDRNSDRGLPLAGLAEAESFDVLNSLLEDLTSLTRSFRSDITVQANHFNQAVPYDTATMAVLSGVFEAVPKS